MSVICNQLSMTTFTAFNIFANVLCGQKPPDCVSHRFLRYKLIAYCEWLWEKIDSMVEIFKGKLGSVNLSAAVCSSDVP